MNVLHICSNYTDTQLYQRLIEAEDSYGIKQLIVVPNRYDNACSFKVDERALILKCYGKLARIAYRIKQAKIYKAVIQAVEVKNYDLVHAHLLFTNGYCAYKIKKQYGVEYIVAVRNTDVNDFFKHMVHLRSLGLKVLLNAKQIVFISETYKAQVLREYIPNRYKKTIQEKAVVIPNGIDDFWHRNKVSEKQPSSKVIRVITVGNIEKNKNQLQVCKALYYLESKGYNVEYIVVGKIKNPSYFEKLKNYSFVRYEEPVQKEQLIEFYRSSDYFILTSHKETFGLVYPEAMSQGLPVIYTKGQGFDGQYKDGMIGYASSDCNYIELANIILKVMADYSSISQRCLSNSSVYDWRKIAEKYKNIYEL